MGNILQDQTRQRIRNILVIPGRTEIPSTRLTLIQDPTATEEEAAPGPGRGQNRNPTEVPGAARRILDRSVRIIMSQREGTTEVLLTGRDIPAPMPTAEPGTAPTRKTITEGAIPEPATPGAPWRPLIPTETRGSRRLPILNTTKSPNSILMTPIAEGGRPPAEPAER